MSAPIAGELASYVVAHRELMPSVEHRRSKYPYNRAENSYQPARQREPSVKLFRSLAAAQRFLVVFNAISPHFRPGRHKVTASDYRSSPEGHTPTQTSTQHCADAE